MTDDRRHVLEQHGRAYAAEHLAVLWTENNALGDKLAKEVRQHAWQTQKPLQNSDGGNWAAGTFAARGETRNPAINARTSNLVLIEADTPERLAEVEALGLPATWTVQSSAPHKRHWYFRPPIGVATLPHVGYRFEESGVHADLNRYLVCPPAIHPSGAVYAFIEGHGPGEVDIATLPLAAYEELERRGAETATETNRVFASPGEKITAGSRNDAIFRFACQQRRWTENTQAIVEACMQFNQDRCEPPLSRDQVEHQVHGAMKKPGGQDATQAAVTVEVFEPVIRTAAEWCALPEPDQPPELIGPFLRRGERLLLGADTGAGKTTFELALLAAACHQRELLGYHGAGGQRALVIDAEQSVRDIKRALREAGLEDSTLVDYISIPDGLALDHSQVQRDWITRQLETGHYGIVATDPLYKLHRGDSNDERAAVELMRILDGWRATYEFGLILPTHIRKAPAIGARFTLAEFFGSSAYSRGPEVILGLQRVRDGYARLHIFKDRSGELPVPSRWGLLYSKEQGFRRDPADTTDEPTTAEKVRDALLESAPLPLRLSDLVQATGAVDRTVRRALTKLDATHETVSREKYFSLPETPDE